MHNTTNGHQGHEKLLDKIRDVRVAMLTTVEADGTLRSRPMATLQAESDQELWFFTLADAPKTQEISHEPHVNLSYAQPDKQLYVSVSGTAQLLRDRQKAKELWNPVLKAWFPGGLEDPNLALLRVQIEQAEYWDAPSSKMVQAVGLVKAIVAGERYEPGENEKLNL